MKQLLFTGLLLLVTIQVAGQTQNADSLINVLEKQTLTADEQIRICMSLATYYNERSPKESLLYAKKGLKVAEKQKIKEDIQWFASRIGMSYSSLGILDTAVIYLDMALVYAKDDFDRAYVYGNMGNIHYQLNNLTTSLEYFIKAKTIADEIGDKPLQMLALTSIAGINRGLLDYDKSLEYYEQAELLAKELNDSISLCYIYSGFGEIFSDKKDCNRIIEYGNKVIDLSKALGIERYEAQAKMSLARVYLYCGDAYKDYDKALEYADRVAFIYKGIEIPRLIAASKELQARVYANMGRYKEAKDLALEALEMDSTENGITKRNLLEMLIGINVYLNNKDTAIYYLTEYSAFIDSYNEKSLRESLVSQQVKYETEKKEMRIVSLEKERQLYVWLGISASVFALSLVIVLLLIIRNARKEKQLIAARAVQDGEIGERARIAEDLHDRLGGSLSAVKIGLKNAESLQNVSDKLEECIKEVREITHNLMPRSLRTSGMKTALEDFSVQFPNVHFHFFGEEKRIRERLEFIVYCCASELITNSIRYSNSENINVQLIQSEKHISLIVQDDGCGYNENTATKGIGLKNIHDRVASCNGKLDIVTSPGKGTETIIELKIEN